MKISRNPSSVHQPLASYAHQIEIQGPQRWLVLSGQVGMDRSGAMPADPVEQFRLALGNVGRNLEAAGMAKTDVVKLTMYLVGEVKVEGRRAVLSNWLDGHEPAMTLLYVAALATPAVKVEIDALACADAA